MTDNSSQPTEPQHNPQGKYKCADCSFRNDSLFALGNHALSHVQRYVALKSLSFWYVYDRNTQEETVCRNKLSARAMAAYLNLNNSSSLSSFYSTSSPQESK